MNNSTEFIVDVEEEDQTRFYVEQTQYYVLPFLITFGILGNSLSAYVILNTSLRKLSSSFYLLALSTNDSVMLLTIGSQWLYENGIDVYNHPILCQAFTYVSDLCAAQSIWLIVVFTGERFVVVKYPLRSKFLCTVRRAKFIILALFVAMLLFYTPLLFIAGLEFSQQANRTVCMPRSEWKRVAAVFNTCDMVFTCLIPVKIIALLNATICHKVWKFAKIRRKMTEEFRMENLPGTARVLNHIKMKESRSSYKMTKMLLVVSTVSLCMILPSYIMRFITHLVNLEIVTITNPNAMLTVQLFTQFLFYLTFSFNFALYCISGQNFRKAVATTFCKKQLRRNTGTTGTDRTQSSSLFSYQATSRQRKSTRVSDMSL